MATVPSSWAKRIARDAEKKASPKKSGKAGAKKSGKKG